MNLGNAQLDNQKKILVVIFCILILYVDLSFVLKGQASGIKSLAPKIAKLNKDLNNLNLSLVSMRAAKAKAGATISKLTVASSKLIAEGQISGLLQEISNEANKLNIKIDQIRPSREITVVKKSIAGDKLSPVLINLDLTADYHNLGKFINKLESFEVFLSVQGIEILAQQTDYMKQEVKLVLKTYVTK